MAKTRTSFKKGEIHNPNGRPLKGYSITEWFKEMFKSNPKIKEAIGKSIIQKALEGDSTAQKLVWNYMDGLPQGFVDVTSMGEKLEGVIIYKPEKNTE